MTLGKRMPVLLSAMLAVLVLRTAAAADSTAALVLDIQGHSVPHLEPYHEIVNLPTIQLAKKTRLTFLHYDTCRMVTVTGGTVTFGLNTYAVATGQIAQESQVDCPQRIRVVGVNDVHCSDFIGHWAGKPGGRSERRLGCRAKRLRSSLSAQARLGWR